MTYIKNNTLFLNTLLFIGLFYTSMPIQVDAIPVQLIPSENIKYPIHIACECDYYLYVDDKYIEQANTEVNIAEKWEQGHPGWNATKKFYPVIDNESPKIIAFNGIGGQFLGVLNGFIMDFNEGKDYTKYKEWKCKDFSKTVNNIPPPPPPPNWFTFDYDDSDWNVAVSFGENYQNNSFQIFEHEREDISLKAEWLWTSDNSNKNIYCRKKNTNIITIPLPTTSAPAPVQTSAPSRVSTTIHPSTPAPVQTSAPSRVQTSAPSRVQTSAPPPVQTSAPSRVQTSAPSRVSTTIHPSTPPPVQTSAPSRVSTTIHPSTAPVPTIVISPHIQIIIQNIKYSQRRSYAHLDNLFRKLKLYNEEYSLYKQLMIARLHLRQHYNALFYDIKHLLEKQNNSDSIPSSTPSIDKNDNKKSVKNIPRYIHSMHTLNECIKKIEQSIQFIKGNHKYILLRILNKLKIQYQQDTEKLFMLIKNT